MFNAHPAVCRTALVGVQRGGVTVAGACASSGSRTQRDRRTSSLRQRTAGAWGRSRPHTQRIRTFLFHPAFPVDVRHNAKIFREKLAVWAARRLAMNALVTGGGGFLGGAIVRRLLARGDRVRSLSRGSTTRELDELGVEQIRGDLADPDAVAEAVAGLRRRSSTSRRRPASGAATPTTTAPTSPAPRTCSPPAARTASRRLVYTSSPSVVFDGRDMEGVDESRAVPRALSRPPTRRRRRSPSERCWPRTARTWRPWPCGRT